MKSHEDMMENPYAPPVATTPPTIRGIEWWNHLIMIAVFLVSIFPMLGVAALYLPLVEMRLRLGGTYTADTRQWLEYALMTGIALSMAMAGVLLVFRRKWSLYLFLTVFALLLVGEIGGIVSLKSPAWVVIGMIIVYTFILHRRSYLR
jgi:hypothetical protein